MRFNKIKSGWFNSNINTTRKSWVNWNLAIFPVNDVGIIQVLRFFQFKICYDSAQNLCSRVAFIYGTLIFFCFGKITTDNRKKFKFLKLSNNISHFFVKRKLQKLDIFEILPKLSRITERNQGRTSKFVTLCDRHLVAQQKPVVNKPIK